MEEIKFDNIASITQTTLLVVDIIHFEDMKSYVKTYTNFKSIAYRPNHYSDDFGGFFPYWKFSHGVKDLSKYNNIIHSILCVFYALEHFEHEGNTTKRKVQIVVMRFLHYFAGDWIHNFYKAMVWVGMKQLTI